MISASLTSCTVNHFVQLKSDGSAIVETDYDEEIETKIQKSFTANQFSFDSTNFRMTFKIDDIDSIGNYLPIQNSGFLKFKNYGNSILIKSGAVEPYNSDPKFCCHIMLRITSEQPMFAINRNGRKIKYKNGKNSGFWISQTLRQQIKNKKNINMTLIKKH